MKGLLNQAVVFTKPVHHLGLSLTPDQLDAELQAFFVEHGFSIVQSRKVTGPELAAHNTIREHYLMYSWDSCIESATELELVPAALERFEAAFGKAWDAEVQAGRIVGNPTLMEEKGIDASTLFNHWNTRFAAGETHKIQAGLVMAWLEEFDRYCINGFYPVLEEIFNHPATVMNYHVVEFDPLQISWKHFREKVLGATNAAQADPESFRGRLYAAYGAALEFPGRDNFAHGSAGPFEGLVERVVHEPDFEMQTNPVGRFLLEQGVDLERFKDWKARQPVYRLGKIFDVTEEKDTPEALELLKPVADLMREPAA